MRISRGAILVVVVLVLVLTIGAGALVVSTRSSGGCDTDVALPEGLPAEDVRLTPFAEDSVWRLPVDDQSLAGTYVDQVATDALHVGTRTGPADEVGSVGTWVNAEQYSFPVVQADTCDPVVSIEEASPDEDISGVEIHIPAAADPAEGTDSHLLVLQPDGTTVVELFGAEKLDDKHWKVGRVEIVDLTGSGTGPDNGARAYGGPALAGLIRDWEIDPDDESYVDGVIRHPLAIAIPSSMLLYAGGDPGYDAEGYSTMQGYVPPATEQDFDAPFSYYGVIPMGARIVLPRSVDVDGLGLSPELTAIARALQDYGGYVVDRSDGAVIFYAEQSAPSSWVGAVREDDGEKLGIIRSQLEVVLPD
jgi:hypothetical protein